MRHKPRAPHGPTWLVRGTERVQPDWDEFLVPGFVAA